MNRAAIQKTIDVMKEGVEIFGKPVDLQMFAFIEDRGCGTTACVAGWVLLAHNYSRERIERISVGKEAGIILDLTCQQKGELFFTYDGTETMEDAILTLENFLETGHVEWLYHKEA